MLSCVGGRRERVWASVLLAQWRTRRTSALRRNLIWKGRRECCRVREEIQMNAGACVLSRVIPPGPSNGLWLPAGSCCPGFVSEAKSQASFLADFFCTCRGLAPGLLRRGHLEQAYGFTVGQTLVLVVSLQMGLSSSAHRQVSRTWLSRRQQPWAQRPCSMGRGESDTTLPFALLLLSKKLYLTFPRSRLWVALHWLAPYFPQEPASPQTELTVGHPWEGTPLLRRPLQSPGGSPECTGRRGWRRDGYWREAKKERLKPASRGSRLMGAEEGCLERELRGWGGLWKSAWLQKLFVNTTGL